MSFITVGELRQNPTAALRAVQDDLVELRITHHGRPIARIVPLERDPWVTAERVAALHLEPDDTWLAEWNAERDTDRLVLDPESTVAE